MTIENRYNGGYEIIGENGIMLCRAESLETAALVRAYLSGEPMTETDQQTARVAVRTYDEYLQAVREARGRKRQRRQERAAARKNAKTEEAVENGNAE